MSLADTMDIPAAQAREMSPLSRGGRWIRAAELPPLPPSARGGVRIFQGRGEKRKEAQRKRRGDRGPPFRHASPAFGSSLSVTLVRPSRPQTSVSPSAQDKEILASLSAPPLGAGLSWLTPGLCAHPSWLRAPAGRWAFVAAAGARARLCPRQQGWGRLSLPHSPRQGWAGLGRGWGGRGG